MLNEFLHQKDVRMFGGCLEDVWRMFGECLEDLAYLLCICRQAIVQFLSRKGGQVDVGFQYWWAVLRKQALALQQLRVDIVVAQGTQAGGHRGIFDQNENEPNASTEALVQQLSSKINIPIIAAGGIINSEQIKRVIKKGASGVQMGSAFLLSRQCGTAKFYRKALLRQKIETSLTLSFSGRLARGIKNKFMIQMDKMGKQNILPFPVQNILTQDIRNNYKQLERTQYLSLWTGLELGKPPNYQQVRLSRSLTLMK